MKGLRKAKDILQKIQIIGGMILIIIFFIAILIQIISRFAGIPMTWTEDVSKFSFAWAVFMGSSWAVARDEHFAFTMIIDRFDNKKKALIKSLIYFICLIFTILMSYYGVIVTKQFWNYAWPNVPEFKMGWVWLCLPVAGITMSFYLIVQILGRLQYIRREGEK